MTDAEHPFVARLMREFGLYAQEHESSWWTCRQGGQFSSEGPWREHRSDLKRIRASDSKQIWKWRVRLQVGETKLRAVGYVSSKEEGQVRCKEALRGLAVAALEMEGLR